MPPRELAAAVIINHLECVWSVLEDLGLYFSSIHRAPARPRADWPSRRVFRAASAAELLNATEQRPPEDNPIKGASLVRSPPPVPHISLVLQLAEPAGKY